MGIEQKTVEILINSNRSGEQQIIGYGSIDTEDSAAFLKLEKAVERYYPGTVVNINILDDNTIKIMRVNSECVKIDLT